MSQQPVSRKSEPNVQSGIARPRAPFYPRHMVILRVFATVLTLVFAPTAAAQCFGTDLRPDLTDAERAELTDRVAAMPFNEGNYWTASRGAQLLHVVGTVHLDEPRLDPVMERLAPVVRRATQLYVEATAEEEAKLQSAIATRPELLFLTSGPTLPDMMEEADWQALADAARIRGIPPFMAAKMQPWYLTIMLSMPSCAVEQMAQGIRGLDHRIMEVAAESDVPQQALEPYDTLFQLMGGEPMDRQIEYLNLGTIPNALSEDLLATLMASYFEERDRKSTV